LGRFDLLSLQKSDLSTEEKIHFNNQAFTQRKVRTFGCIEITMGVALMHLPKVKTQHEIQLFLFSRSSHKQRVQVCKKKRAETANFFACFFFTILYMVFLQKATLKASCSDFG